MQHPFHYNIVKSDDNSIERVIDGGCEFFLSAASALI